MSKLTPRVNFAHQIPVAWRPQPFNGAPRMETRPEGGTLADIVASIEGLPPWFETHGVLCLNGEPVPRHLWRDIRPRVSRGREVIVTLHIALHGGGGGGGGGKNTALTVAAIAVAIVATIVTSGAAAPLLGSAFAAGTIGATLAGAAVGLGGSLAIAALAPPPSLDGTLGAGSGISSRNATGGGTASLRGNVLSAGSPIPRVIGTHRVFPPFLAQPLIEVIGDDEYAEAIYGLAGPHKLQNIRVGATDIDQIGEIQYQTTDGAGVSSQDLVRRQAFTDQVLIEVSQHMVQEDSSARLANQTFPDQSLPKWHVITSRLDPDEIWVTLNWPRGMFDAKNISSRQLLPVRMRMRKRGTMGWTNFPEIMFKSRKSAPFSKVFKILWGQAPVATPTPEIEEAPTFAFKAVPPQVVAPAMGGWTADVRFSAGAGNDVLSAPTVASSNVRNTSMYSDRVEFFMDPSTQGGEWEIQIISGALLSFNSFNPTTYIYADVLYDHFGYYTSSGFHVIRSAADDLYYNVVIPRVASIWNEPPVSVFGFAQIAVRVHNRQIDRLSVLASGLVPDWDGAAWTGLVATSNPAPHFRYALAGSLGADPIPVDLLDNADIVNWRTYCATEGLTCDAVVEGKSAFDAAALAASCGMARPRQSETWGVTVDRDRAAESPVQMFTPRNARGFSAVKAFTQRPDGLRVRFNSAENDYEEKEIIVYDPETPGFGERLEDLKYDGLVTEAQSRSRALFDLAQASRRMTFYSLEADAESVVCRRGDLVAVQHDTLDRQAGFARISEVFVSAGLLTGLRFDGSIPIDGSGFYDGPFYTGSFYGEPRLGVAVRKADGTLGVHEATATGPDATVITFVAPFADAGGLYQVGALVAAGHFGREYRRLIVTQIEPREDLAARLTLVDEAPELFV